MSGTRKGLAVLGVVVVATIAALLLRERPEGQAEEKQEPERATKDQAEEPAPGKPYVAKPPPEGLKEDLSSEYLQGYGKPGTSPVEDLALVESLIDGFLYTVKVPDALPAGENREVVAALLGDNPYLIRFVDPGFSFINDKGEITDRWQTPLFFHFVGSHEIGIRSAGPDRKMWTPDDFVTSESAEGLGK